MFFKKEKKKLLSDLEERQKSGWAICPLEDRFRERGIISDNERLSLYWGPSGDRECVHEYWVVKKEEYGQSEN